MADAIVEDAPVEIILELSTIVGVDPIDAIGQVFTDVVDELNGRASVVRSKILRMRCRVRSSMAVYWQQRFLVTPGIGATNITSI